MTESEFKNKIIKMEFTKQEKNRLYKKCLEDLRSGQQFYCCASFHDTIKNEFPNINLKEISVDDFLIQTKTVFHELFELKTLDFNLDSGSQNEPWFWNTTERIIALKKCIELTK